MENSKEINHVTTSRNIQAISFMNPTTARAMEKKSSSHSVNIICRERVRCSFVCHLFAALSREGISVFVDEDDQNQTAISWPMVSVVVFSDTEMPSPLWFSNKWSMVAERRRNNGHVVIPVIYDVGPSIRNGSLRSLLEEGRFTVHQSRNSTTMKHSDSELVEEIVEDVCEKLFHTERIGIYSKLLEIRDLLCKQPWEILRSIGLWGMPGIGKTTLAKAVFDHMSNDYDVSCFIENFDESYLKAGLYSLLEDKIGNILKEKFGINSHYIMTPSIHEKKLGDKRILVVLDDVRDSMAAESFLGKLDCFGPGSLVIMTSRDKQVFPFCRINQIYEVQGLKEHKALQMFSHIAFGKGVPEENYNMDLTKKVIDYANGNPLALSIYGQELKGKKSEMESVFLKLKQYPPQAIQDVFKSVYSTLGDNEKNILLDIACFFNGENVNYVVQMLEGCRYFPRIGIDVLMEKCLVTISENKVQMSNLIQDISQVIFNGEVESCTRILEPSSIRYLLGDGEPKATSNCVMVAEDIESISLDTSKLTFDVRHDAFKNTFNLRFLKIYSSSSIDIHGLNLPKGLNSLPCQLRLLHWEKYPLQSLPQDFDFKHLIELSMPYNHLQKLVARTKNLKMLKRIRLCHSQQLVELDLLSDAQNIELIDLQGCIRLKSCPDMSELHHLRVVNLSGCTEIKRFSSTPPNIEELHLQGTRIKEIPICNVTRLDRNKLLSHLGSFSDTDHMDLESVKELVKVSSYDQGFGKLVHLNLKDCSQLQSLPDMVNLESLQVLLLSGCSELKEIKGFPRNMRKLYLGGTAIREMPQLPQSLEFLNAHGCKYLKTVRLNFEQLPRHYTFSNCYNFPPQMIAEFLEKSWTGIESLARAKQQELIKAPEVSICIPISARQRSYFRLQEGPITTINIAPSTRKALSGFAISVVVSFGDGDHDVVGLGIRCVCTWKTTNNEPDKVLERLFRCWAPKEAPKVEGDHIFVFYDTGMHPSDSEEELLTWAREVKLEFYTVSWENKLLGANCQVKECDVQVITAPTYGITDQTDEIIRESEVVGVSEVLEAKSRSHSFRKPHKFYSVTSKVRSKKTMFWKWLGCFSVVEE